MGDVVLCEQIWVPGEWGVKREIIEICSHEGH